jgi:SOS-response transcriptional repressor LexA
MMGLTRQQARALDFVRRYANEHGFSPSFQEVAAGVGLASKGGAKRLLDHLRDRGFISFAPRQARSIQLIERPAAGADLSRRTDGELKALIDAARAELRRRHGVHERGAAAETNGMGWGAS